MQRFCEMYEAQELFSLLGVHSSLENLRQNISNIILCWDLPKFNQTGDDLFANEVYKHEKVPAFLAATAEVFG